MSQELSLDAVRAEGRLIEALRSIPADQPSHAHTADLRDAFEGVARTFPFDGATRERAQAIDGFVEDAFEDAGTVLTLRGLAWILPSHAQHPFMITVQVDDERSSVLGVGLSMGVRGRDLTTSRTSREVRDLEDALRNDPSGVDWAYQDTWTRPQV